ncbi:transcriptional regulator [Gorillibacterium sp. sgz500922]|uniref:transcriptional regulator n=1 Tax=Gorillibacterium sp. sgz500922 TaxID=3446694 RepID=UPI003F66561C
MRRLKLLGMALILSGLLAGCAQPEGKSAPATAKSTVEAAPSVHTDAPPESAPPLKLPLEEIQGHIKNVHYADEDHVLIAADKLYLYDFATGRIIAETSDEGIQSIHRGEDGYEAVRATFDPVSKSGGGIAGGAPAYSMIFYDSGLVKQSEFSPRSLLSEEERMISPESIAFSADGKRAAYATDQGLYLYDFKKEQQTTLIDLGQTDLANLKKRSGIVAFERLGFTNEDRDLAFTAQSFDIPPIDGKSSFSTCGTVHGDGSSLTNQTFESFSCRELINYDKVVLFAEDLDFTAPSGKLLVMKMPGGKPKFLSLTEAGESRFVSGSDKGGSFATALADRTDWKVRIYDTNTGKLEKELRIPNDGDKRYMAQVPIVKLLDEKRLYIVLVGAKSPDVQTNVVMGQF